MNCKNSLREQIKLPYPCPFPWTSLYVNYDGGISFCCFYPPFAHVSQVSGSSIKEIWNGKTARELRQSWKEGNLKGTPCSNCFGLNINRRYGYPVDNAAALPPGIYADNVKLNISELNESRTVLKSMPVDVLYVSSVLCNIDCVHCCQPAISKKSHTYVDSKDLVNFYHRLGYLSVSNGFSGGEPLYLRQTYKILDEFPPEQKLASELILLTNAQMIKEKFGLISGFRKYTFEISIASYHKQTYEYIHRGASFEKLIENLEFLLKCREEGLDIYAVQIMVLMKSNFTELEKVFSYVAKYKLDELWIFPVQSTYSRFRLLPHENIFLLPYLLGKIPSWPAILESASRQSLAAGNRVTYNHIEYIRKCLPGTKKPSLADSIRAAIVWLAGAAFLRFFPHRFSGSVFCPCALNYGRYLVLAASKKWLKRS